MRLQRAFTLLELIIAISIAAILVSAGFPGFKELLRNNHRATLVNELVADIQLARSESITHALPVTVCKSVNGRQCSHTAGSWQTGWLLFVNIDGDSPASVDVGEPLLRVRPPLQAPDRILANHDSFTFRPFGLRSSNGTLIYCDDRGTSQALAVIISPTGRPRLSKKQADGSPLNCAG